MTRRLGKFVPSHVIRDRMDGKDLRFQAAARAIAQQAGDATHTDVLEQYIAAIQNARLSPVVEVALEPLLISKAGPVVECALVPVSIDTASVKRSPAAETLTEEIRDGSACSSNCGFCGRCTDGINTNCLCADCGEAFWKGPHDSDSFCDGCRAQRDAHTEALELRMAKAAIAGDVKKEVA